VEVSFLPSVTVKNLKKSALAIFVAAVLPAEVVNASDCKRSRSISLWMYLSLAVEGNGLVCLWPHLDDEQLRPTGEKSVSQTPGVPDLQSLDVFCNTACGEVEAG